MSLITAALAPILLTQSDQTILYRAGLTISSQKISLKNWGSGLCSETSEASYSGATSIRITTKNLFQGGSLVFGTPVDLFKQFSDKTNLLRIVYRPLETSTGGAPDSGTGKGKGSGANLGGGGQSGIEDGGESRAGQGNAGAPSGGKGQGGGATAAVYSTLNTMRLIITTTDGQKSEAYIEASTSSPIEKGWRMAGVPLQAIRGFERTNKIIKDISFAGDVSTAFFVGDIRLVSDKTPITATPTFRNYQTSVNENVTFSASANGGSSVLKYSWDFDDADGIQEEAEGSTISHRFLTASNDLRAGARPGGVFNVTLTVSDAYGLKTPYSTVIKVKVNP